MPKDVPSDIRNAFIAIIGTLIAGAIAGTIATFFVMQSGMAEGVQIDKQQSAGISQNTKRIQYIEEDRREQERTDNLFRAEILVKLARIEQKLDIGK